MKIYYKGKYNGDASLLPTVGELEGAVPFNEIQSTKTLMLFLNIVAFFLAFILFIVYFWHCKKVDIPLLAMFASLLTTLPHEYLHAIWFKEDAYIYSNLKQGVFFVISADLMEKWRFIWLSLCPNLVLGFIPFFVFLINPEYSFLGVFGIMNIVSGVGDYYNIINAFFQMPKGSKTYIHYGHNYWVKG